MIDLKKTTSLKLWQHYNQLSASVNLALTTIVDCVHMEEWGSMLIKEFSLDEEVAGKYALAMADDVALQRVKKVVDSLLVGHDIFHTPKGKDNQPDFS